VDSVFKQVECAVKEVDRKKRQTVGIVSTSAVDREGDMVDQSSLGRAMAAFVEKSGVVVYQHSWTGAIGRVIDYESTKEATRVKVQYGEGYRVPTMFGDMAVDDIWKQIEQGMLRTHSHAFAANREDVPGQQYKKLTVTDLYEVSVVVVPANADATFSVVKSMLMKRGELPQSGLDTGTWFPWFPFTTGTSTGNETIVTPAVKSQAGGPDAAQAADEQRQLDEVMRLLQSSRDDVASNRRILQAIETTRQLVRR
jgi:hypothetical protein